jgi:membrane protein
MSSKSAKKSEQRRSNQQQDSAQASQNKQRNQPPVQGEQPQPPQTFQNQTAQYVVFNYSKKGTVIGQSVAYGIGLFFSVGFAAQLLSMSTSIEKFTDVSSYFFIQSVKVFMPVVLGILIIGSIGLWITYLSNRDKNIAKVAAICTLFISIASFVTLWLYLNFYAVVGFGDVAFFFSPIPFGVMILGIVWCTSVFKYQNEKSAHYANVPPGSQSIDLQSYPNQPQFQYSQPQGQALYSSVPQQYPQNTVSYPDGYGNYGVPKQVPRAGIVPMAMAIVAGFVLAAVAAHDPSLMGIGTTMTIMYSIAVCLTVLSLLILIVVYFSAAGRMKPRTNKIIRIIVGILLLILMILATINSALSYGMSHAEGFGMAEAVGFGLVVGAPVVLLSINLFISSEKE